MTFSVLSEKQKTLFKWCHRKDNPYTSIICDGAVRSGKTSAMTVSFILWAMRFFDNADFAICGKTVRSAERNIIIPLQSSDDLNAYYDLSYTRSTNVLTVSGQGKINRFYVFGGRDESSYTLIQGITLSGVLLDEVALMPRSFVEQAIARTLSVKDSKLWFNCNPEGPQHWFYTEWIQHAEEKKALHLHFLMSDNPIMSEEKLREAESMFKGVFYDRYIRGLWVQAEGLVFPDFAENPENYFINKEKLPQRFRSYAVGADWGGNGSAYALTCSAVGPDGTVYVLKSSKKQAMELPMKEVEQFVFNFIDRVEREYKLNIRRCNCDHSEVIINTLNERRYIFGKTYKPPLEDRPFKFSCLMATGKFKLVEGECDALVKELESIVYDPKSQKPIPLDDGTMQIDTYDSLTYSVADEWNYLME